MLHTIQLAQRDVGVTNQRPDLMKSPMSVYRVVLADDQEEMLRTIAEMIEGEFHIIGTAANGQKVIELVREIAPDLLVLDISMPLLNGLEIAVRLKQDGSLAKLVFLTIHGDSDFVAAAMDAGALGYVFKPCLGTDLLPAMRDALAENTFISPCLL